MSGSSEPELLRRLIEFELELERRSSEQVEEFDWGRLIVNPDTAEIWRDNFLEVSSDEVGAGDLATLADDLLGGRGFGHRYVTPRNPARGEELEPGFRERGWEVESNVYMVLRRAPDRQGSPAAEVPRADIEEVRRAVAEADPDFTPAAVDQRLIRDARFDPIANGRWFAAPADREPGAACVLYELDGIGQVETVVTKPEVRRRGLATAVVLAAVEASRRGGHELTFIVADADDWPWKLYERLGFDRVGLSRSFLRKPGQPPAAESP
jgi:ribosomal protein S18 acetylase RimI-like enzyme